MAAILADDSFEDIFLNKNDRIPISNFNDICSQEFNWQQSSIGSGNNLSQKRRQAITWTNAHPVHRRIYVALGGPNSLSLEQNAQFYKQHFQMHFTTGEVCISMQIHWIMFLQVQLTIH